MNIQKIAEFLLERRRRASPILMTGEAITVIESEGLQEALQRRWLVPDPDTGNLQVTADMNHVHEMEAVAQNPPGAEGFAESASAELVLRHAGRERIEEIAAPATGKPAPTMGTAPSSPPPPRMPSSSQPPTGTGDDNSPLNVGDDALVAQEGKTYTGKVSARTPQGRYRLSFGPERPALNRDYEPNEVRRVGNAVL